MRRGGAEEMVVLEYSCEILDREGGRAGFQQVVVFVNKKSF